MNTTALASSAGPRAFLALSPGTMASCALAGAALLWSGSFIAARALRQDFDPVTLSLLRWTIALVAFLPFIARKAWRSRAAVRREWKLVAGLGASGIAAFHTLTNLALHSTTALNAILMLSLAPTAILVGGAFTGAGRPTRRQWLGMVASLVGAGIVATRGSLDALLALQFSRGDLWMIPAVLCWTAYSLLLRCRPADLPPDVTLFASIVPGLALLAAAELLGAPARLPMPTPLVVGGVLYIAIFASLVAFSLWSHGVALIGPERAGQYVHLMPLFGAVLSTVLLGEAVGPAHVAGGVGVLAGIILAQRRGAP